jgi:hypothetical protein
MPTAAPACVAALAEATRRWPGRSRAADGILPSAAHTIANPTSDHERGLAFDLTHDPAHGVDCNVLAEQVMADRRVRYVIWNRRIWNPSVSARWRDYTGSNPHTSHMHVSILAACREDRSAWWTPRQAEPAPGAPSGPVGILWDWEDNVKTTMLTIPLDKDGNGWTDWDPALGRDPIPIAVIKQGPSPPNDGYWMDYAALDLSGQQRDGKLRVTARGGPPGGRAVCWATVA